MRQAKLKDQQGRKRLSRFVGTFDKLEDRCLLAPTPILGTQFQLVTDPPGTFRSDGFVTVRLISTQPGRIEADPTGSFGNDVFVISRGTAVQQIWGG